MTRGSWLAIFAGWLGLSLPGCTVPADYRETHRTHVRWQLVEKRYRDLADGGVAGDGRVDPNAVVLAFEPVYAEELAPEVFVSAHPVALELLSLTPADAAAIGETVTARLRVAKAELDGIYRLKATARDPDVVIHGRSEFTVRRSDVATFRFTRSSGGQGGIMIAVERIE